MIEVFQKGHPIYSINTKKVDEIDNYIVKIIIEMEKLFTEIPKAAGLAANQIGYSVRIIAVNYDGERQYYINPKIIKQEGTQITNEVCGSIKGIECEVERPETIIIAYKNLKYENQYLKIGGVYAWVVCHEIDHLDGIWITDKAVKIKECKDYDKFFEVK